eukprot:759955-Alexandrium_andersonii.AAC.1
MSRPGRSYQAANGPTLQNLPLPGPRGPLVRHPVRDCPGRAPAHRGLPADSRRAPGHFPGRL